MMYFGFKRVQNDIILKNSYGCESEDVEIDSDSY